MTNKYVWIFYPCAGRKKYSDVNKIIIMLKQFAIDKGYIIKGITVSEKSCISRDSINQIIENMQINDCSILLVENINKFCRNEEIKTSFYNALNEYGVSIINYVDGLNHEQSR